MFCINQEYFGVNILNGNDISSSSGYDIGSGCAQTGLQTLIGSLLPDLGVLACTAMTHLTVSLKSATNVRALHDPLGLHSTHTVLIVHRLGCKHAELILWFGSLLPGLGVLACTEMTHLTVSAYLTVSMNRNGQMSHSGSHEVSFSHFSGRFSGFREKPLPAVKVAKSTLTHKFQDLQVQALFNTRCHGEV